MNKRILFSPIGGTDPIRYLRDGSLLHICRHYRPDIIYLYLSQEMLVLHRKDNRYVDCLEKLGKLLGHSFEIHLIERDELVDVQQYDVFYQDFREEISRMEKEMDDSDELLLNMASGTPAMKSALLVIATLAEYRMLPIQVDSPQNRMNSEQEDRDNYDNEVNWELNQDNEPDAPNRCTEVKCFNLMRLLKIETIKKHINSYDYPAALSVADEIKNDISEDAYRLLQIADARIKLNHNKISKLSAEKGYDIYPIKEGNKQKVYEYALVLQIKIEKQEYADFIRGITPLVVELLENILKSECGIVLDSCCTVNREGLKQWNRKKLEEAGLMKLLDEEYKGGFRLGPVYSNHIAKIIEHKSNDITLKQKLNEMVAIESTARNMAAHEIVSVTDEWFQKKTGKTAKDIFKIIKYLITKAGINAGNEEWKSYNKMNAMIESCLQ